MGSIKNERKMCKLGIEYLIDMTNMRPDDLNRQTLGKIPCLCKKQHSRFHLAVEIVDTSFKSLFKAFLEVNKIIQSAKKSKHDRKVLIFGIGMLEQQVICACSQYLMVEYELNLDEAMQLILQKNSLHPSRLKMNKFYIDYLKRFEVYLKHVSEAVYGSGTAESRREFKRRSSKKKNALAFYDFYSNQEIKSDESHVEVFEQSPFDKKETFVAEVDSNENTASTNTNKLKKNNDSIRKKNVSSFETTEKNAQLDSQTSAKKEIACSSKLAWM